MEALGINIVNIVLNTVIFILFFLVLHFLVFKRLASIITKREEIIEKGLENTAKSEEILRNTENVQKQRIADTDSRIDKLLSEAKQDAKKKQMEIISKAQEEAKDVAARQEKMLDQERQGMQKEFDKKLQTKLKNALVELLSEQTEKIDIDITKFDSKLNEK